MLSLQLLKFIFGIVLAQMVTVTLMVLSPNAFSSTGFLQLSIPLLFIALIIAFWFTSLSEHSRKDAIFKQERDFAKEREKIKLGAKQAKIDAIKEAQKEIVRESKTTHAKANFKVGMAFAGVLGIGGLFVLAQMVTVGLLAISAGGGVIGGYYWRGKRIKQHQLESIENQPNLKIIQQKKDTKVELLGKREP